MSSSLISKLCDGFRRGMVRVCVTIGTALIVIAVSAILLSFARLASGPSPRLIEAEFTRVPVPGVQVARIVSENQSAVEETELALSAVGA